jgi:hypothetical protein
MADPLQDIPPETVGRRAMNAKAPFDVFLESTFWAFPVVYIALVLAEIDSVPDIGDFGGLVFFGGLIVGPVMVGALVALIRAGIKR